MHSKGCGSCAPVAEKISSFFHTNRKVGLKTCS